MKPPNTNLAGEGVASASGSGESRANDGSLNSPRPRPAKRRCVNCIALEEARDELVARNLRDENALRAALARAAQALADVAIDLRDNGMHPDDAAEHLAKACVAARDALA